MGYNFNYSGLFQQRNIKSFLPYSTIKTSFSDVTTKRFSYFRQPEITPKTTYSSTFAIIEFIDSFKKKYNDSVLKTYGYNKDITEPKIAKDTSLDLDDDFVVSQNYGIMCPTKEIKDTKEPVEVAQNYGIMCPPKDTEDKKELFEVAQNYGIACPQDLTFKSLTDDYVPKMMMNYGIVCSFDID